MNIRRWQDWVILIAGVWLVFAPFYMTSYGLAGSAALNSVGVGVLLVAASGIALARPRAWPEWINTVLGVWLVVSPFVLGFQDVAAVTLNHVVIGIIVVGDAMIALARPRGDVGAIQHR
jgi:SPW repeat